MKLVKILWVDSSSYDESGWKKTEEVFQLKPVKIISVGFIIRKTEEFITIASHKSSYQVQGEMTIPVGAILEIKKLK